VDRPHDREASSTRGRGNAGREQREQVVHVHDVGADLVQQAPDVVARAGRPERADACSQLYREAARHDVVVGRLERDHLDAGVAEPPDLVVDRQVLARRHP
jgi:hypothetical protein